MSDDTWHFPERETNARAMMGDVAVHDYGRRKEREVTEAARTRADTWFNRMKGRVESRSIRYGTQRKPRR